MEKESTSFDEENKHLDQQNHEEGADRASSSDSDDDVRTHVPLEPQVSTRRPKRSDDENGLENLVLQNYQSQFRASIDSDDDVSTGSKAPRKRPKPRVSLYDGEGYALANLEEKKWMPSPAAPTPSKTPMVWKVGCGVALLVIAALITVIICVAPGSKG